MAVVELKSHQPGNGAREAVEEAFGEEGFPVATRFQDDLNGPDRLLAALWAKGFKVVPLDDQGSDGSWDVVEIQRAHFRSWVGRKLWAIIDQPNGQFQVYQQTPDGVAPPTDYPTLRKAAARLLQLLATGPVAPQTWPEDICIGHVEHSTD